MSKAWPVRNLDRDGSLAANARRVLKVRLAEFDSHRDAAAQPAAVEALHDLRIAAKRLRYTLELFRPVFGEEGARRLAEVKEIQERLGLVHDCDVRIELIRRELAAEDLDGDARAGMASLLATERGARDTAYESFRIGWEETARSGMREALGALARKPRKDNR